MVKIVSWNIAKRRAAWRELCEMDADVASAAGGRSMSRMTSLTLSDDGPRESWDAQVWNADYGDRWSTGLSERWCRDREAIQPGRSRVVQAGQPDLDACRRRGLGQRHRHYRRRTHHTSTTEGVRPLIICPAPLVDMWERYNEVYQLNARVLSMGVLREGNSGQSEQANSTISTILNDVLYHERNFVLVDESHNFRHPDTQRYKVLQTFLATGRRCCFLTATPRNKSAWDIYHQIKLFSSQ